MRLMDRSEILDEVEIIHNKLQELNDYTSFHTLMDIFDLLTRNKRNV